MISIKLLCIFVFFGICLAQPAKTAYWKGTPMNDLVEEMRASCAGNDAVSCMKFKVMNFLDMLFKKDNYQVSDAVEISRNSYTGNYVTARHDASFLDTVEEYLKSHDITFKMPLGESKVTFSPRNIDKDELNLSVKFEDVVSQSKGTAVSPRKSKLKKIVIPILVFIMLKALTLIPLALGVLSIKAWNALQLSFFSFVVSLAMAVFQLCKKIAHDQHAPQIAAHGPWDQHYARAFPWPAASESDAHDLAYNAFA